MSHNVIFEGICVTRSIKIGTIKSGVSAGFKTSEMLEKIHSFVLRNVLGTVDRIACGQWILPAVR
jgi:hypothetical protein